jgi:hypothetical protein
MAKTYDPLSFTKAKTALFNAFIAAVGSITTIDNWTAKEGRNSFKSFLPPAFDVWGFTMGGGGDVRQTYNTTPPWELQMDANIEGQFRLEESADEVGMKLLSVLDVRWMNDASAIVAQTDPHRIQSCRMRPNGNLDVFLGPKPIANEGIKARPGDDTSQVLLWQLHIGLTVVFNTWNDV